MTRCAAADVSGGLLEGQAFERLVEDRVAWCRRLAELDVGLVDRDRRFQTLFVERCAGWREIAGRGQPQAAVVRQLDQPLDRGAADGVLANQLRALVAGQRRGEEFGGAG